MLLAPPLLLLLLLLLLANPVASPALSAAAGSAVADQTFKWVLAYKQSSASPVGDAEGMDEATVKAAWASCNVHFAAIKYEIAGKVHSIYRRTHGPDGDFHKTSGDRQGNPEGASAWKKEGADFNAFELMTGCWRSKQASGGAPNTLNSDFQMFSSEAAYFDRSTTPGWAFCNYDDCTDKGSANEVGFPRDCAMAPPGTMFQWHLFTEGKARKGAGDVAFYVNTCGGWTPPVLELGDPTGGGWEFVFLLLFLGVGYFIGGSALGARRKGEPLKKGPAMLQSHPHHGKWMQLHGLVQDGVNFSRARIDAKRGVNRRSYAAVSTSAPAPGKDDQDERRRTSGGIGKSKRSSKEAKSKGGTKEARSKKGSKSSKSSKAGTTGEEAAEVAEAAAKEKTVAEEKERLLQEERSAGVHSSQQAIKVIGLG